MPEYFHSRYISLISTILTIFCILNIPIYSFANSGDKFTVVLDPGHGGHDHGATENNAKEKDINLAVALKVGDLLKKKMKNTNVVFTRDDDTFISLQGRADIANKSKADLFVSIHTNSVDLKNKNRRNIEGASVYTQGPHKDEANLGVARRENSVIELENGFEQKYCGFDPNKDESYIIFEMAQKKNLSQSNRFAKYVQDNLVSVAGRKNRGVHQAGFWVLWSTSMPSVLIELDFICNPESAKFLTSEDGVNKLAEAIYQAINTYYKNIDQKRRMTADVSSKSSAAKSIRKSNRADKNITLASTTTKSTHASVGTSADKETDIATDANYVTVALAQNITYDAKDMSHANLDATRNQRRARHSAEGRRRRSASARNSSNLRNLTTETIILTSEFTGATETITTASANNKTTDSSPSTKQDKGDKKSVKKTQVKKKNVQKVDKKQWVAKINNESNSVKNGKQSNDKFRKSSAKDHKMAAANNNEEQHAGSRKSLRARSEKNLH